MVISGDERRAIARLYGFAKETNALLYSGANVNMMKAAEADGLRLIAWLAKHLEPGADPLKTLVDLTAANGWDVDPRDVEWAQGAGEGEEG